MTQTGRASTADDQALRAEIAALRRAGQPLDRKAIGNRYGVGVARVQQIRAEVDRQLAQLAEGPAAGRTVAEFDGRRLFELRRARDLMQEELGRLAVEPDDPEPRRGVSRGEIGHLERTAPGPRTKPTDRKPTLRTLRRLALALGVNTSDLLELPHRLDIAPRDLLVLRDKEREAEADERARNTWAGEG
jgi:transcriptional regulator with XRE-family HTH domain